jgi:invasion protein IalB
MSLKSRLLILSFFFGILMGGIPPARADSSPSGQNTAPAALRSTQWHVECDNNGKALDCQIINHIVQPDGNQVASIAIHPIASAGKTVAVVQLPFGIALSAPIHLSVPGTAPVPLTLNTCLPQGCFASAVFSDPFISGLIKSSQLTLSFAMANNRSVTMGLPLNGFALAYDFVTRK